MTATFKGVIFDFDCTLADSKHGMASCVNAVLSEMGYPEVDFLTAIKTIGHPPKEKFSILTGNYDEVMRLQFKNIYQSLINPPVSYLLNHTALFPGAIDLLSFLKKNYCKIAIVSNKSRDALVSEIMHLNISHYVDMVSSLDDVIHPKPDPSGIHNILSTWKISSTDILYVGDHAVDAAAAQAASVKFVGVTTGSTTRDVLMSYENLYVAQSMNEVFKWFLNYVKK